MHENAGRVALQRGLWYLPGRPITAHTCATVVPRSAPLEATYVPDLLGRGGPPRQGWRRDAARWGSALYRPVGAPTRAMTVTAIPYYAWANRAPGEMLVWLREA